MIGNGIPLYPNYNDNKFRDDTDIDKIETPNFTHECQVCGHLEEVNDYQKHTPNWCESCETVQTFVKLK